jgi:hypothetical protein
VHISFKRMERQTLPGDFESPPSVPREEWVAFTIRRHPTFSAPERSTWSGRANRERPAPRLLGATVSMAAIDRAVGVNALVKE